MKTGYQFLLRFRQIKGSPVGLRNTGNIKQQKSQRLNKNKWNRFLGLDHIHQVQGTSKHNDAQRRKPQRQLITDHLGRGAQTAHQ